jgi:hypothetical protein
MRLAVIFPLTVAIARKNSQTSTANRNMWTSLSTCSRSIQVTLGRSEPGSVNKMIVIKSHPRAGMKPEKYFFIIQRAFLNSYMAWDQFPFPKVVFAVNQVEKNG